MRVKFFNSKTTLVTSFGEATPTDITISSPSAAIPLFMVGVPIVISAKTCVGKIAIVDNNTAIKKAKRAKREKNEGKIIFLVDNIFFIAIMTTIIIT